MSQAPPPPAAEPSGAGGGAFSFRAVAILIVVGTLCFATATLLAVFSDPQSERTFGANAYSQSAIGYKAWAEILRALETPILISRNASAEKAVEDNLLIVAQPHVDGDAMEALETMQDTWIVLLVLPKWEGRPDFPNRRWLAEMRLLDPSTPERVLSLVMDESKLQRSEKPQQWRGTDWNIMPSLTEAQLIQSPEITPIVESDDGVLLGEVRRDGTTYWVLSDPDVISNIGIDDGDNAAFAVAMVQALLPPGGTVIFDEAVHGFTTSPDLWRALLTFPLNLAVLQMLAAVGILIWAAAGRFGAPSPAPPRLEAGKRGLIENTANLFEYAGNLPDILRRYHDACLRDLGRHMSIPRDLDEHDLRRWLDRVGEARGTKLRYSEVNSRAAAASQQLNAPLPHFLRAARRLYRWKQEMIHGHRADPNGLRSDTRAGSQDRGRTGRRA
ncbi:hypothetical protein HBA54_24760 [Pelagibius litoralis]|uniref:DUF4350 domain-containing protein n=1 Tax=Pelagibius litoralis TaxID=374515 RepID=A0A967F2G4_9PROT|nr:DUF4350 domain-containing protein [Pelagibius litoralis]NIA71812.1 hypothetical protein [Pelagibius litoralis]